MARFGREPVDVKYQVELAEKLYKYQNFKSSVISSKVKSDGYQGSSIVVFHTLVRRYLNTGEKDLQRASQEFYKEIDRVKSMHLGILTPSEKEKARPYTKHNFGGKGNSKVKVTQIREDHSNLDKVINPNTPQKINLSTECLDNIKKQQEKNKGVQRRVGILVDNVVKLFKNEDQASGYIMACNDVDPETKFQLVDIVITPRD